MIISFFSGLIINNTTSYFSTEIQGNTEQKLYYFMKKLHLIDEKSILVYNRRDFVFQEERNVQ